MKPYRILFELSCALLMISISTFALAQSGALTDGTSNNLVLEEITVTAQKRAESVQDVPISITVLDGEHVAAIAPDGLLQIAGSVPNMVFAGGVYKARPEVTMRGIFSNVRNIGFDAGVGIYVDGVYMGRPISFNPSVLDIAQVEVLRGPQGSLFGKNTSSGAISVTLRRPQAEPETHLTLGYGNYGTARASASVNVPLVENRLYGRFAVFGVDGDGYINNVFNGTETGSEKTYGGRVQLRWLATDALEFNLSLDMADSKYGIGQTEGLTGLQFASAPGRYTTANNVDSTEDLDAGGIGLTTEYTFDNDFQLTSITAWRKAKDNLLFDNDNTPLDINRTIFADDQQQFSQEIRLASPLYDHLDYVVGLYFFHQSIDTDRPVFWGTDFFLPNEFMANYGDVETDSYAGFGQVNFRFAENWNAFAGIRFTREQKDLQFEQDGLPPLGLPDIAPFQRSYSDTDTSPTIGISYKFKQGLTTYAKFSRGYKSGGFNADFITSADNLTFGPEHVSNYEVGAKALVMQERLRLALALFYMDYEDMQVSQFNVATGGFTIRNAGESTSKGVEFDLTYRSLFGLEVTTGLGYTNAEFDQFKNGGGPGVDFDGNRLPRAPEYTFNLALAYQHALKGGKVLNLNADYNYRSDQFTTEKNIPTDFIDGYGLVNARIGLTFDQGRWSLSLWSRNLLDDHSLASSSFDGINGYVSARYVEPRTYGVNLSYRN